ncbi:hypothetical protein NL676_034981 [Syzygium grande]|nr:hypothetical protein NL676_034981 [Syzygium grande]
MTLCKLRHAVADLLEKIQWVTEAAWILVLSYFIAYLETVAISNVLGTRGSLEVQNGRRYPGMLDNRKLGSNNSSPRAVALKTGAQQKLNMVNQDSNKVGPYSNSSVKQSRFQPSGNNSPTSVIRGPMYREVADLSEQLADMSFGNHKGLVMQQQLPPLKAGRWRDGPCMPIMDNARDSGSNLAEAITAVAG